MNINDIKRYLRSALRTGWRIIGKLRNAIETDGLITLFVFIVWFVVQNTEKDVVKTIIIWLMNSAALIALAVRSVQVKRKTRGAATLHKEAKMHVKIFSRMAFTLAMLSIVLFIFRHLMLYGPESGMEIIVAGIMFMSITSMTIITMTGDRT